MKIVYLSSGGDKSGFHDHKFLVKLCEKRYDTYFVSYSTEDIPQKFKGILGLKIIHHNPKIFPGSRKYLLFIDRLLHFKKVLKEVKPDVLHSGNLWNYGFLGSLSSFHPHLSMPFGSDILVQPDKLFFIKWINKFTLLRGDMVTCDNEIVKRKIIKDYGYTEEKIVVFPWGIELDMFNPKVDGNSVRAALGWEDNIIVIMTRHLLPIYGISYFIKALPQVIYRNPKVRVILIGSGPLESEIKRLIKRNQLEKYTKIIGRIDRERMAQYLNAADIYVSSSLSDGTSVSLLEAMACGLPIIISDLETNREWIKDYYNGFLVSTKNVEMLSNKIICLAESKELRRTMGQRNLKIAKERADWDKNFKKLEHMYELLLKIRRKKV